MSQALKVIVVLIALVTFACLILSTSLFLDDRWTRIDQLKGWKVYPDIEDAIKRAHLKRHPKHDNYTPESQIVPLTPSETTTYGKLNEKLHERLRILSHKHFANVSVPKDIQEENGDETYFTPFTYQNYDWYGPTYECYFIVFTDYISADLLHQIQLLLKDEYQDWCIRVIGSDELDFDTDHDIAVFSDQILVTVNTARVLNVPKDHR